MSTILIVDDDETVLELIAATVRFLGYASLSTLYSTQTFRILEKNSIDLILLDVHMPVLDGIALLRQIISHPVYKKIPVIMLTIDEEAKLLERCFESGAADFITKPVQKLVLKSRIKSALSTKEYIRQLGNLNENLEKKVEERTLELHKSEKRYRAVAEDMPVLICRFLPDGEITYVNEAYCQYFQKTPEESVGYTFLSLIPETDRETVMANIATTTVDSPTQSQEYRVFAPNGEIRWQRWTNRGLFDAHGKVVVYQSVGEDITERKQAEEALSDYKQQMYAFSLATTNMLSNWDLINNTVERNIGFEKAFGYTKEEIVPNIEWWVDRLHPDDSVRVLSIYENAVKKGYSTCSYEYRFRLSDGNYSYISDNVYIVRDENGKAIRSLGAMTDITKRKEAEELLREQKKALERKNIALGEVLSHIELEKKEMRDNVIANAENLLLPIIEKIRLKGESRKYVKLLKKSLKELTSSFGAKLTSKEAKLTSREIEICNMIKNGLASLEIADLLNISGRTVEKHRNHIRTKLGIRNKDINLTSFLKTL